MRFIGCLIFTKALTSFFCLWFIFMRAFFLFRIYFIAFQIWKFLNVLIFWFYCFEIQLNLFITKIHLLSFSISLLLDNFTIELEILLNQNLLYWIHLSLFRFIFKNHKVWYQERLENLFIHKDKFATHLLILAFWGKYPNHIVFIFSKMNFDPLLLQLLSFLFFQVSYAQLSAKRWEVKLELFTDVVDLHTVFLLLKWFTENILVQF